MTKWGAFVLCAGALFGGLWPDVRIGAVDEGVTVTVDGQPSAVGAKVSPGLHLVVFQREGYADQELELNVGADEDRELRPEPWERFQAKVDLGELPKDATVTVAGRPVSGVLTMPRSGKVAIVVRRPDHYAQEIVVDARLGETMTLALAAWDPIPQVLRSRRVAGTSKVDAAVARALVWLVNHQSADGRWDSDGYSEHCSTTRCTGGGRAEFDPALTGLSLLALMGAGHTPSEGNYVNAVSRGLDYLLGLQEVPGGIDTAYPRSTHFQYNHLIATVALSEAWWWTHSRRFAEPLARARRFIIESQNPYLAWRYGQNDGDNDTSVTVWAITALRTMELAGATEAHDYSGALKWLNKMTDVEGRTGYQKRGGLSARIVPSSLDGPNWLKTEDVGLEHELSASDTEALTAAAVFARTLLVVDANAVDLGTRLIAAQPFEPQYAASPLDLHYAYYGSLARAQLLTPLKKWHAEVEAGLLARQALLKDGCADGSWDPAIDAFGSVGGRVYSTALATLALQAQTRYPRVWNRTKALAPAKKPGTK